MPIEIDETRIADSTANILGDTIARPELMRLGNPITLEVSVPVGQRSRAGEVWVHRDGDDPQNAVVVLNAGPNRLPDDKLIYRSFVYVKLINGQYLISGEAPENAEYTDGAPVAPQRSISGAQIDLGLLKPTNPASMKTLVSGWRYILNGTVYNVPTLLTQDFTADIPGSNLARGVLIELDPTLNTLFYTNGVTFSSLLSHDEAFVNYPATVAAGRFVAGYVKLKNGMTSITQDDILPAHELLNKGGGGDGGLYLFYHYLGDG